MQEQDLYEQWCPKNGTVYFMESVGISRNWGVGERVERWGGEKGKGDGEGNVCESVCGLDRLQKVLKNLANVCLKNTPSVPKNRHLKT